MGRAEMDELTEDQPSASVRGTNIAFDKNTYLNHQVNQYTVTVEYNCPAMKSTGW